MNAHLTILASGGLWPTISLVIFFLLFLAIVAFVVLTPTARWKRDAQIPLENDSQSDLTKEKRRG